MVPFTPNPLPAPVAPAPRNVETIVLGNALFKTWYGSFYPEEAVGRNVKRLHVCQLCFKYSKEVGPYLKHMVSGGD